METHGEVEFLFCCCSVLRQCSGFQRIIEMPANKTQEGNVAVKAFLELMEAECALAILDLLFVCATGPRVLG